MENIIFILYKDISFQHSTLPQRQLYLTF